MAEDFSELEGIFDDLTPADFGGLTTIESPNHDNIGAEAFQEFLDANIRTIQISYLAAEGQINPVAILANADRQWIIAPDTDETLGRYIARLTDEARRLEATWFFISRKTLVAAEDIETVREREGEVLGDVSDPDRVQAAIEAGRLVEGVFWFAARREDEREVRCGIMEARGSRLEDPSEGTPDQAVHALQQVLP